VERGGDREDKFYSWNRGTKVQGRGRAPTVFYGTFRVQGGRLFTHWIQGWKNEKGKLGAGSVNREDHERERRENKGQKGSERPPFILFRVPTPSHKKDPGLDTLS